MVNRNRIELLTKETIDQIAAGEVVERPASVVKELTENAIDAGSTAITVEIKDGGISYIRISDNGDGILRDDVRNAFLRHSTSKIKCAEDLYSVSSLGFRGEALSSISAVSKVELMTKTKEDITGVCYRIEGGEEKEFTEMATPDGTTFIVRQLFFNTPARKKFLKSPMTEGNYISEVVEKLAISNPGISFRFLMNSQEKFVTSGNGNLLDVIYQLYGKDITKELLEVNEETAHFKVFGYIGKPLVYRGNRNYETFFVNKRYVKSQVLMRSVEAGYEGFLMQHQYPFAVLNFDFSAKDVDVNVHPTKQEVRFHENDQISEELQHLISNRLKFREDISDVKLEEEPRVRTNLLKAPEVFGAEPFEKQRLNDFKAKIEESIQEEIYDVYKEIAIETPAQSVEPRFPEERRVELPQFVQQSFLTEESLKNHRIIGQVFDTYWLVEFDEALYIIDQHAAHEKVLFEKTMAKLKDKDMTSQQISPPIIVSLSDGDCSLLFENEEDFHKVGYAFESFGGNEVALTGIPANIFGVDEKELFLNTIASLSDVKRGVNDLILEKIASMSCKAAVKGHDHLSFAEAESLISDLLSLENPYHCPHGRPTIVRMSQYELDKKFKRIV